MKKEKSVNITTMCNSFLPWEIIVEQVKIGCSVFTIKDLERIINLAK